MDSDQTLAAKARLRREMLERRAARLRADPTGRKRRFLAAAWRDALLRATETHVPVGETVAAFLPTEAEPPLREALRAIHESGRSVIVPVSLPFRVLEWAEWTPEAATETSSFGIDEPTGDRLGAQAFSESALRLVPALAVDEHGTRLGYGGGYYDAALAAAGRGPAAGADVAVCFSDEVLPAGAVPAEPHDARLPRVCTEHGLTTLR